MAPITHLSQLDFSKNYTYADYLTWKFDEFVELIKGKAMRPMAGPSRRHQEQVGAIFGEIRNHLKGKSCRVYVAPFDVRLTTGGANGDQQITTVVQPDICVVCDPAKLDDRGCLGRTRLDYRNRIARKHQPATPKPSLTSTRKAACASTGLCIRA
ncbi:MAG: Uma2 family endonuclease [Hymenobacter sp.]